ncbi:MAG: sulfatase [Candidatus Nanohaloarchaea archaeon]|nr:sulfatase [Candidatus Nanohaloarchaea archaeon]
MPPNIVLFVMDSARPDGFGCYGSPSDSSPYTDRLAESGVKFTNAYAAGGHTPISHAGLFTGYYPSKVGATGENPVLDSDHTLARELSEEEYETLGILAAAHISEDAGYASGFDDYIHVHQRYSRYSFNPDLALDTALNRIWGRRDRTLFMTRLARKKLREVSEPFFLFMNYQTSHRPYRAPFWIRKKFEHDGGDPKKTRELMNLPANEIEEKLGSEIEMDEDDWKLIKSRFHAVLHRTDRKLGSIMNALKEEEMFEDTIFIVTSDHGDEFGEHDLFSHGYLYETNIRVPLVISGPGIPEGVEYDGLTSHLDLLPTFVSYSESEGKSIFPLEEHDRDHIISEETSSKAIRNDSYKLIHRKDSEDELYNLDEDPGEHENLIRSKEEVRDRLVDKLPAFQGKHGEEREPEEAMKKRLEDLGYL